MAKTKDTGKQKVLLEMFLCKCPLTSRAHVFQ